MSNPLPAGSLAGRPRVDRRGQHLTDRCGGGGGLGHQSTLRGGADAASYAVHSGRQYLPLRPIWRSMRSRIWMKARPARRTG